MIKEKQFNAIGKINNFEVTLFLLHSRLKVVVLCDGCVGASTFPIRNQLSNPFFSKFADLLFGFCNVSLK